MEETKFASLKLVSGEELICYVLELINFGDSTSLVIKDPLKVEETKRQRKTYKLSPWIMFTNLTTFDIPSVNVLSMSKLDNIELQREHAQYFSNRYLLEPTKKDPTIGYVGSVKEYKKMLEDIYKNL